MPANQRFIVREHSEKSTGRKWWTVIDTGYLGESKSDQVGINFVFYDNALLVVNALNQEWNVFQQNPW